MTTSKNNNKIKKTDHKEKVEKRKATNNSIIIRVMQVTQTVQYMRESSHYGKKYQKKMRASLVRLGWSKKGSVL